MKKNIFTFIMIAILVLVAFNINSITGVLIDFLNSNKTVVIPSSNGYSRDYEFMYLDDSDDYIPYSYHDLINIYYSFLNNGWDSFTFYCPIEYGDCVSDVKKISENNSLLTHISNYVHPYNSFVTLNTIYDQSGEITLKVRKLYTDKEIDALDIEVSKVLDELIKEDDDDMAKILKIHDYIINKARYDEIMNETGESEYRSNTAYGPLFNGFAICGGYADSMALFLNKLDLPNYKIASDTHVWNAVYVDGKWFHLDLTWDDPIDETGENYLHHKYFLINNTTLKEEDGDYAEHNFDKSVYLEFNY